MCIHFTIFLFYFAASYFAAFDHFYPLSLLDLVQVRHTADVFVFAVLLLFPESL